ATSLPAHPPRGFLQQRDRHPTFAPVTPHEEARHRPYRLLVHGSKDLRPREPRIVPARLDRAPADGLAVRVGDQSRRRSLRHAALHHLLRRLALLGLPLRLAHVPPEAPAPGARAVRTEERFEVPPAVGCEGLDRKSGHGTGLTIGSSSSA